MFLKKQAVILLFAVLVFDGVYLPEIISEARREYYGGWSYLDFPIQDLELCGYRDIKTNVGGFVVLVYVMRLVMLFLIGNFTALLSSFVEKVNSATVLACGTLVVPICIVVMDVAGMYNFTFLLALRFTQVMLYGGPLPLVLGFVICIIALAINAIGFCRLTFGINNKALKRN